MNGSTSTFKVPICISVIVISEKDVTRTDRTHKFFEGECNPNLQVLNDVLMTYCMYNFDLGKIEAVELKSHGFIC